MFPKLPAAVVLVLEMHLSMSVKHEDPGTLGLVPVAHLLEAAGHGWCATTLDRMLIAELYTSRQAPNCIWFPLITERCNLYVCTVPSHNGYMGICMTAEMCPYIRYEHSMQFVV